MDLKSDVDEKEILSLWKDISFPGSFRGVKTFQALLKTDKNIQISQKRLYEILRKEPSYLIHQLKPFKIKGRSYITHNYGELVQADIAYMFEDDPNKFKYFLLLIDVYSSKIFVESLKNKESATVAAGLQKIFQRFGAPIYELQSDKGSEFNSKACKALFKKLNIYYRTKRGLHKAGIAESAIFRVKRKLYIFLRANLSQHWSEYIEQIVDSLNEIPLKRLGFLRPNDITDITSSVKVDAALRSNNLSVPKEPTYEEQNKNQKQYDKKSEINSQMLQKGDYVYLKQSEDIFGKSFDIQGETFELSIFELFYCTPI